MLDSKTKAMQDTFWTPELWCEFLNQRPLIGAFETEMEQFKSSKSPKKEWEIVAFAGSSSGQIYQTLKNGRFALNEHSTSFALEELLASSFPIHSVRRLSDASEWQVKETVEIWDTGRFTIQSFEINAGQMLAKTDGGTYLLNALIKLPQPILTTADQKDLFSRQDEVWVVNKDNEIIHRYVDTILDHGYVFQDCRFYSTPEAARDYVLNHAPLLSLSDVKEAIGSNDVFGTLALRERLTALVKQKLNQ